MMEEGGGGREWKGGQAEAHREQPADTDQEGARTERAEGGHEVYSKFYQDD